MDPGPQEQNIEDVEDGHNSDSGTSTQTSEYMTDSGTDSDEELHCGAEPHWVDVAAKTLRTLCAEVSSTHHAGRFQGDVQSGAHGPRVWNEPQNMVREKVQEAKGWSKE